MARAPSIWENLQSTVEYLRNLILPAQKLFLNKQREEKWSIDALRSFVYVGQYLASLVSSNLDVSMMEKKEIDLLKYRLEYLERNNTELVKELNFTKDALQEAQKSILHQDEELWQTER